MSALSEVAAHVLNWQFPRSLNAPFELNAEGVQVGWLRFDDLFGARAIGELDGKTWVFDYNCLPHPSVSIFTAGSETPVAEYVPRLIGGGLVTFASGVCYCWNRTRIWSSQWCFRREGQASICMTQHAGPLTEGGRVSVCQEAAQVPETAVLVLLAWYLRVLAFETLIQAIPTVG
jgi:hypothetical protein